MGGRKRADTLLVEQGLAESQERAQALILSGRVWKEATRIDKAGQLLPQETLLQLKGPRIPYVGRGGIKLAGALDHFSISVAGKACLDVGASTGGFTDCLLQRGALLVMALDVGKGQLDWRLAQDARVLRLEGVNARYLRKEDLPRPAQLVTVDVSFISLAKVLPAVLGAAVDAARSSLELLALVKPQFEVERHQVGPGGLVRDDAARQAVVERMIQLIGRLGWWIQGCVESPLRGAEGNLEFFICARHEFQQQTGAFAS